MQHGYWIEVGASCRIAMAFCITSLIISIGHLKSKRLRGRIFSCKAMASSSSWLCPDKSVPLGRYWRIRPLMFSLLPRCQGLCGSQK
ncbi:hypothetical protein D3C86_1370200 [compost metagenome]